MWNDDLSADRKTYKIKKPRLLPAQQQQPTYQGYAYYNINGGDLVNKSEIEQALRDYHWMINEIKRQRELLSHVGGNVVAHIDDMPKGKGTTGDPVAREVMRRDKASRWVQNLEDKVLFIQERIPIIKNDREKVVLQCMLDGLSMKAIGQHMGLSRSHIYNIKESIIEQFAHFGHNGQIGHKRQEMTV